MTPSELKASIQDEEGHFFDRKTMKFFGDTMRNYGVVKTVIHSKYNEHGFYFPEGVDVEVWELYRKSPVKHGLKDSAYFSVKTFKRLFPSKT